MSDKAAITRRQVARGSLGLAAATLTAPAAQAITVDTALPPAQTPIAAIPAGQISAAIQQLDALAKTLLRQSGIPGLAVAVVRNGRTVYAAGFGKRHVDAADKVDADTVFQLASLSKSVSATILAHQIGRGGIAWTTPLIHHLSRFALSDPWVTNHVTLADMFAHRSGLPDHAGDDLEDLGYNRSQILERLRYLPLHSFRDIYDYTNFGITAAAQAVAEAAGANWEDLAEAVLYQPLDMPSTSSRFVDFMSRANRATGHVETAGIYQATYQRQPDAQSPAGGVSSSVRDMAHWLTMVLQGGMFNGKQVVSSAALLPAVTAQIITSPTANMAARPDLYGYGFNIGSQPSGRVTISHSGAFAYGAGTNFLLIPSLGLGIIALTNAAPSGAAEALTASFADLVQFGTITRDWYTGYHARTAGVSAPVGKLVGKSVPADRVIPSNLQIYTGIFENTYYGAAEILLHSARLTLKIGPQGKLYPLRHWDGSVFVYTPTGENAPEGSIAALTFTSPASFSNDFYTESGMSQFVRR